jgi:hypothetical protein
MVRFLSLVCLFSLNTAQADFLGLGGESTLKSQIPTLIEELRAVEVKVDPAYEDSFNEGVRKIENRVEQEKLYCTGEAVDSEGKTLTKEKKQLCIRDLKKHYVLAMDAIYELKKKYLGLIHKRQLKRMDDVQVKIKADIEKNF